MALWQLRQRVEQVFGNVEEIKMDEAPFSVTEEYQLGDLTEVKEDRIVLPVQRGVKFWVQKASQRVSKDGSIKSVAVQLNLVDGILMPDGQVRYQNKPMFVDMPYWADPTVRTSARYTGKNQAYLVPLKSFLLALGYDLKAPPKIGDDFYTEILGREVRGDIAVREIRVKNLSGEYEGTGEYRNEVRKFQPA